MTTPSDVTTISTDDITANGYRVRLHTTGSPDSPAIVWLHGSGPGVSALSNWEHLITRFATDYHNLAPDILGFGDSDHPEPAPIGMPAYTELRARTLLAMLDALGVTSAHLVGNSMGVMIALRMAQLAPDHIDRMILMGSGGAPLTPGPALIRMITFYNEPTVAAMSGLLTDFVHDPALFAGELDGIAADRLAKATRPEVRRSHEATFDPSAPVVRYAPEELAVLPHETLVIHGREDKLIPVTSAYYFAEHLPNAQLHVLPHAGHWIQIEQAERFAALAQLFLGEQR